MSALTSGSCVRVLLIAAMLCAASSCGLQPAVDAPSDGVDMAYVVGSGAGTVVTIVTSDGRASRVEVQYGVFGLAWSPAGERLLCHLYDYHTHRSSLWMVERGELEGPLVRWTDRLLGAFWAPDSSELFIIEADWESHRLVDWYGLELSSGERVPVWFENLPFDTFIDRSISPDWQHVAYYQRGTSSLVVVGRNGDGWSVFDVPSTVHGLDSMAWSDSGNRLAFSVTGSDHVTSQLYAADIEARQLVQLTTGPGTKDVLGWSPSGSLLAFHKADSHDANQLCYTTSTAEDGPTHCWSGIYSGGWVHWISDTALLLTTNRIDGHWDVYRVTLTDEVFTNLTEDEVVESHLHVRVLD
jgi:Tol biopolymer transport system component